MPDGGDVCLLKLLDPTGPGEPTGRPSRCFS
jgi:hypothetical protein